MKKNNREPGISLPGENQDPFLKKDLPADPNQRPGPEAPGVRDQPLKDGNIKQQEDEEPVDERSEDLASKS